MEDAGSSAGGSSGAHGGQDGANAGTQGAAMAPGSAAGIGASAGADGSGGPSGGGAGGNAASGGMDRAGAGGSSGDAPDAAIGAGACTRELLASMVERYFAALAAHDPSRLPLAAGARFTENGVELQLGEGLWQRAGTVRYKHSALDTELCTSVSEAVVPEGDTDLPVGVRLKLEAEQLTEIETIVARPGDYVIFGSAFESDPEAIIASAALAWEEPVAAPERATRDAVASWITRYFERFPNGGCNLGADCLRLENGGGSFPCSLGARCSDTASGGGLGGPLTARLVVVDDTTGVGVGFTMFMGNTDMHMIMLRGGEIRAVHTILSAAASSGWD